MNLKLIYCRNLQLKVFLYGIAEVTERSTFGSARRRLRLRDKPNATL